MLSKGNNYIEPNATRLRAVDNGYFYAGNQDTDPTITANQVPVYYVDESGNSQIQEQPIKLNKAGVPVLKNGQAFDPVIGATTYSFALFDKLGNQIEYDDSASGFVTGQSIDRMMGYTFKGDYLPNPVTLTNEGDYVLDSNGDRWFALTLPHTTNPTTYPNPIDDPLLSLFNPYAEIKNGFQYIDNFGDVSTDATQAFIDSQNALGFVRLRRNTSYNLTDLSSLDKILIFCDKSTVTCSAPLFRKTMDIEVFGDITFDGQNSDMTQFFEAKKNSRVVMPSVHLNNIDSQTFCRALNISTDNCYVKISGSSLNLNAKPNGTVGDLNGSCRAIYIGDTTGEDASLITRTTNGSITLFHGVDLTPTEDGDLIHVQSSSELPLNLMIDHVSGDNVAKRIVKIQAEGVQVGTVHADASRNADNMYAVVSHYGKVGSVERVTGSGKILNGVDTQYSDVIVDYVDINSTATIPDSYSGAFRFDAGGTCRYARSTGLAHIAYSTIQTTGLTQNTELGVLDGVAEQEVLLTTATSAGLGNLNVTEIKATSKHEHRTIFIKKTGDNQYNKVEILKIDDNTVNYFTVAEINAKVVYLGHSSVLASSSVAIAVTCDKFSADYIETTSQYAVRINNSKNNYIGYVAGGQTANINTSNCTNTLVNVSFSVGADKTFKDEFSTPSTGNEVIKEMVIA